MASVLCAIHCAVTPVLLIVLPNFAKVWAHPAAHWGMALFVIPIAVCMIYIGYKKHARRWIVLTGIVGIIFIIIGSILPYVDSDSANLMGADAEEVSAESPVSECGLKEDVSSSTGSMSLDPESVKSADTECVDNCCPSIVVDDTGKNTIYIPPASIVTSLGGLCLIIVHGGNLYCCCANRRKKSGCKCC